MSARLIAVWVVVALSLAGPLQPLAQAQQPGPRAETKEDPTISVGSSSDNYLYDIGAAAITVVGFPPKLAVCAISGVLALGLLLVTLGSAHRTTAWVVEEGCGQNWIVTGNDIRPDAATGQALEWDSQRGGGDSR